MSSDKAYAVEARLNAMFATGLGPPLMVIKPSVTTRQSTASPSADPHLLLPAEAGAQYFFVLFLVYASGTSQDLQWEYGIPSGGAMSHDPVRLGASNVISVSSYYNDSGLLGAKGMGVGVLATAVDVGTFDNSGGGAGNFVFRWAQYTSGASDTSVYPKSALVLWKAG